MGGPAASRNLRDLDQSQQYSPPVTADYSWFYQGPNINTVAPITGTADAIQQVFTWFNANGGASRTLRANPTIPGLTPRIDGSLASPYNLEYAGGVSRQFGSKAAIRADVSYRNFKDAYVTRVDQSTGKVVNSFGQSFDLALFRTTPADRCHASTPESHCPVPTALPRASTSAATTPCLTRGAISRVKIRTAARRQARLTRIPSTSRRHGTILSAICKSINVTARGCGSTTACRSWTE
jgi:hypothetical protein